MPHIVLNQEQLQVVTAANAVVEVRDDQGKTIAHLTPLRATDIALIEQWKHRQPGKRPLIPSEQVQVHLRRLEEIRTSEGLDEAKMLQLLRRMQTETHQFVP
jgi:hypothetical protein